MPLPVASKAYVDFYKLQYLVKLPLLEEKSRGYCNLKKKLIQIGIAIFKWHLLEITQEQRAGVQGSCLTIKLTTFCGT